MSIRLFLSIMLIIVLSAYAFGGEHEELLTAATDFCKLKHTDRLIARLYTPDADYVINGNILPMAKYLEALEDGRSLGTTGAYNDTIGTRLVTWSGNLGAVQLLTRSHNRIDDDETVDVRVNLMVFRKSADVWKLQAWYSMTLPKEDRE